MPAHSLAGARSFYATANRPSSSSSSSSSSAGSAGRDRDRDSRVPGRGQDRDRERDRDRASPQDTENTDREHFPRLPQPPSHGSARPTTPLLHNRPSQQHAQAQRRPYSSSVSHSHSHSHSQTGSLSFAETQPPPSPSRATVPMWDSADPDRAPPPLPMHPGTSPRTKPNTSAMIQNTVAQLTQKAEQANAAAAAASSTAAANPYSSITLKPTVANNKVHRPSASAGNAIANTSTSPSASTTATASASANAAAAGNTSTYSVSGAVPPPLSLHTRVKSHEPLGNRENFQKSSFDYHHHHPHVSLTPSPVKERSELSAYLEQHRQSRSPVKLISASSSRTSLFDPDVRAGSGGGATSSSLSPERSPVRSSQLAGTTSTANGGLTSSPIAGSTSPIAIPRAAADSATTTPNNRPTSKYLSKPILGENTPPSATMLALQNMHVPSDLDRDIYHRSPSAFVGATAAGATTSMSTPGAGIHQSPTHYGIRPTSSGSETLESLAAQIRALTNIATNLQAELTSLSRRSKDNATDLMSLKDATSTRDEDIRKSLKDLSIALNMRMKDLEPLRHHLTQGLQSQQQKPASRRSSPSRDRASSPRPSHKAQRARRGSDGSEVGTGIADRAVSLELLSKIMRDMSTREGMEAVLRHVEDVRKKENATDADTRVLTMLEEILTVATEPGVLRALSGAKATAGSGDSAELDESLKQVQSSLQATSHMTADVKTLVEEVKQGITALGSDIGERLAKQQQQPQQRRRQRADTPAEDGSEADEEDDDDEPASLEEIAEIVDTGLNALRRHLEEIIDDSHRRSVQSAALSRNELYDVVVRALSERRSSATSSAGPIGELERGVVATAAGTGSASAIARDDVMAAVKDGLEKYIPQVNVQTTGLDRGEVLKCLEDGLSRSADRAVVDYDKVRRIMSAALESWDGPPLPGTSRDAGLSPEDIERVVRKALDEAAHDTLSETTRKAVADGMTESQPSLAEDIVRGIRQHLDSKEGNMRARVVEREEILATIRDGLATSIPTRSAAHDDHQQLSDRIIATIKSTLSEMDGVPNATAAKASETSGTEEIIATIKQAFDDLSQSPRDIEINSEDISAAVKESMDQHVTEQLALLLEELKAELAKQPANGGSAAASGSGSINQQTLDAIKQSLEKIQLQVTKIHDGSSNILGKEAILQMLREELAQVQTGLQQTVTQSAAAIDPSTETARLLDALEKEFTHMRGTLKDLVQGERGAIDGKGEILDAIHEIASSELLKGPGVKQAIAEIKKELADMQQGMEPEAVAQAVKSVVDRVSSDNQLKEDSRVRKLIDEFGKGLDQVKQEIGQMGMTKHTEVVMESLRDDMKGIKERLDRKATADTTPSRDGILSIAGDIGIVKDLENLKLTLNAVHEVVKTTAEKQPIDAVRQSDISPLLDAVREVGRSVEGPDVVKKKDIEQMVSTVRETLEGTLHANAKEATGEAATQRELETVKSLLTALKGQMEDLVSPEGPVLIRSAEQLKDITTIVEETKLAVQALRDSQRVPESGEHSILSRADGVDDVSTVTKEIWMMMEDVKRKMEEREATRTNPDEKVYKKDVQGLETLTFEIKTMISDLQIPDPAVLPTKTDLQELSDVVTGFRDKVAAEAKETARAFEARKEEHGSLASKIDDAKGILEAVRTELREGHATAGKGVETLQVLLQGLTTAAEGFATRTTITDMTESLQKDLAKLATAQEEAKEQLDRTGSAQARKVDETRERLTTDLVASFDARFNDVGTRLDEERTYLENKFELSRTRDINQLEALSGTKAAMENLVGVIREEAHEFYEKSQRSFASLSSGLEAQATLIGTESGKTTAEVKQLEEQLGEMQPAIITAVQSVLEAVGQLSKTSDQSQEALLSNLRQLPTLVAEAMPKVEVPPAYDDTPVRGKLDTLIKHVRTHPPPDPYDDSLVMGKLDTVVSYVKTASSRGGGDSTEVQEKLDEIVEMIEQLPEPQVYDDAPVQEKLDTLIDQSTVTGELLLQMDKLDAIQAQVKATQQEMVEAMAAQKAWFATEQTSRRKEAEEAAILLEKRRSQKEKVEQEILALHDEKDTLLESVRTLRNEKEELTRATGKLARELSSLETALRIRKEEMRVMEERAEALEKRVIEGVLDHTRGLLVERGISTSTADLEGASAGQMRRVKRDSGHGSIKSDAVNSSVAMALKRRGPPRTRTVTGAAKRILSLNNASINANRPMDRRVSVITPSGAGGSHGSAFPNLKRSHSVKQGLGAGRNFSLDSGRGALEGQGQQSAVALASGLDLSIPLSEEQEHDHEQEHEYDEGRDTPSSKYETPYETPHRVETPANHDGAAGDDTASAEATPVQPRDGAAAATVYGKGGRRGADTRSTISSLDRPSFDSSTDLTTPASIQDGFAADGQRCFSGGDGDAIESTYDESFAHSPHRDDRNHSMAEVTGYTQGTYDEGTEYGDDDDNDNDGDGDGDGDVDGKRAA